MPPPFRQFSPANLFVAEVPFIWLPALLVTSALFGHSLVFSRPVAIAAYSVRG